MDRPDGLCIQVDHIRVIDGGAAGDARGSSSPVMVRDLDVIGVSLVPDEADAPGVVDPDAVLTSAIAARLQAIRGGTRRSPRSRARSSISSFFRAARRTSGPRPVTGTSSNTALVRLSAKDLITQLSEAFRSLRQA